MLVNHTLEPRQQKRGTPVSDTKKIPASLFTYVPGDGSYVGSTTDLRRHWQSPPLTFDFEFEHDKRRMHLVETKLRRVKIKGKEFEVVASWRYSTKRNSTLLRELEVVVFNEI